MRKLWKELGLTTRPDTRFAELRLHIYGEIQRVKGNRGGEEQAQASA